MLSDFICYYERCVVSYKRNVLGFITSVNFPRLESQNNQIINQEVNTMFCKCEQRPTANITANIPTQTRTIQTNQYFKAN